MPKQNDQAPKVAIRLRLSWPGGSAYASQEDELRILGDLAEARYEDMQAAYGAVKGWGRDSLDRLTGGAVARVVYERVEETANG